ncbi:large ribosomal subunit protein mL43-like [Littorina saxatilis]|uniref:Large ribosomal subunit protein mL43 n=1 Tax=Littorina saxatilis TaxID=31220 RepID=A0AAN9BS72_9CAEN
MSNRAIPNAFVKNVLQNGLGRYICQLQRVTLNFCKATPSSLGTRDFIEKYLVDFTRENPGTVVYVKPIRNRAPFLVAEYLNGRQERVSTKDMPADEVCKWLEHLRTRSGAQIVNLRKEWLTNTPSTQGVWHPFLNKNPSLAGTSFPAPELYGAKTESKSATDMVLEEAGVKKVGSVDSASSKE